MLTQLNILRGLLSLSGRIKSKTGFSKTITDLNSIQVNYQFYLDNVKIYIL